MMLSALPDVLVHVEVYYHSKNMIMIYMLF